MLYMISNSIMTVFGKVFTVGDFGEKACSNKLHPFPAPFYHL